LVAYLENPPVKSRVLRRLGVRRETVQSLGATFRISEAGSNKIIDPVRHARIYSDDDPTDVGSPRVALPPTYSVAACLAVARWDTHGSQVVVPPDRLRPELVLVPGLYRVEIVLLVDGEPQRHERRIVVGRGGDDLSWSD